MDKTALITGCNSALGIAMARELLDQGYKIIAHYHSSSSELDKLDNERPGGIIKQIRAEFDKAGVKRMLKELDQSGARIDALINNAATAYEENDIDNVSWDNSLKTFEVNYIAPLVIAGRIFTRMKTGGGKIINISSISAKYGGGFNTISYGASKAALDTLTLNLAGKGAEFHILVNTIRPGLIDTDFHKKRTPSRDLTDRLELTPLKRMARPDEIASMVGYLCSEKGDYITGEIINIAGGD